MWRPGRVGRVVIKAKGRTTRVVKAKGRTIKEAKTLVRAQVQIGQARQAVRVRVRVEKAWPSETNNTADAVVD